MTISEIRNIHPLVADLVCQRIREQGNEPDESKDMDTDMEHGGFDWDNTPERHMPWKAIHYDHNFEPLFSLYPELRGEGGGQKENEIVKKIIQVGQMFERGELEYTGAEADILHYLAKLSNKPTKH